MLRRITAAFAAGGAIALSLPAIATAATPTVRTGPATDITGTSAVLRGAVDPNGADADALFNYGPTTAYGATTVAHNVGSGQHAQSFAERVTGLQPGTVYHYRIAAVSATGTVVGADASFTTAGAPPSSVATGPASPIGTTTATPTATINPNGAATPWLLQYGLTAGYGLQSFVQPAIGAGFTAVPVSLKLEGLAPATLFHYRFVAFHGALASYGADGTFFTRPTHPASPDMTTRTTPGSDGHAPYRFTTTGTLKGGTYIPAAYRCAGTVGIRYFSGGHQLAYAVAGVNSDCTFSASVSFRHTHGSGSVPVRISVFHRSNGYLGGESKTDQVHAG